MKQGIAFIRGISMFGKNNYIKEDIFDCLKQIENDDIKIIEMFGNDNVIFEKNSNIHFATVGTKIEKCLTRCFDNKFSVTTRSSTTVERIVQNLKWRK